MDMVWKWMTLCLMVYPSTSALAQQAERPWYEAPPYRLLREGNAAYDQGNNQEAMKAYEAYGNLMPNDPRWQYNLGNALFKNGQADSARYWYQQAAQNLNDPNHQSMAWHNLGNSYMQAEDFPKAVEAYKKALLANPKAENTRYNLSYALKKLQEQEEQEQQQQEQEQQQQQQEQEQEQEQQQQQQEQQERNQQKNQELTREQAQRLLDALDRDERELQKKKMESGDAPPQRIKKPW